MGFHHLIHIDFYTQPRFFRHLNQTAFDLKAIYAYVTLNHGEEPSPELYAEVRNWVRKEIGPLATPDVLHWTDSLPKTRSGKIMRRILRKIAADDTSNLGDTSTLADPGVVEKLLEEKQAIAMPS